jgi:Spy/CpxP family protein refolding chaperone
MKTKHTSLFMASLTLALAGSAFAQNSPAPMTGTAGGPQARPEMREHMCERMTENHTKHLGELKTKLKLDASQEAAWKTFADNMQAPASVTFPDRNAMTKLSTPERIDKMQALHTQRDAEMKKRGEATKTFYAGLNAEQKKTFDAETARHMQREMGKRGQHHPH